MNIWDILILAAMIAAVAVAVYVLVRTRQKGNGCCGECSRCSGCSVVKKQK